MFSGLSKLADKSFVLGFFLPALVGTIACIAMNRDLQPFEFLFQTSLQEKTFANLSVALLTVWTLSVLLMAWSHWMYRVLEGYNWPLNLAGLRKSQVERRKTQREAVRTAYDAACAAEKKCGSSLDASSEGERKLRRDFNQKKLVYLGLKRTLALEYPEQPELVLPTRFGNVLRAFEMYAGNVYGVESIHAWPRLLAVVPKEYQVTLADARAPVDFFVSLVFISFALGVVALARIFCVLFGGPGGPATLFFWIAAAVAFVAVRLSYLAAVSSAVGWGEVVKSTFDLYLPAMANAMGYQLPKTAVERRLFWGAVANQFQFHEPIQPELWPAGESQSPAAEPSSTDHAGERSENEAEDGTGTSERDEPDGNERENQEETAKNCGGAAKAGAGGSAPASG